MPTKKTGTTRTTHIVLTALVLLALILAVIMGFYVATMFDDTLGTATPVRAPQKPRYLEEPRGN